MADESVFTLELRHEQGYEFRLKFDWDGVPDLLFDEPAPLGERRGANASRVLAAAVANCLTASLLFCLRKAHLEPETLNTRVTAAMARNAQGRQRIDRIEVAIALGTGAARAASLRRCAELFEDYCVVTQSVRQGIPVVVRIVNAADGAVLFED